jgi:hypothetical protein
MDISELSARQLLKLHADIEGRLRELEIIRSANNPTGDLAEYLFCKAFPDWVREGNSQAGYDAKGTKDGLLYQIKGRRITHNRSRQLSAIRSLERAHFDYLAGVLFNEDYSIFKAALIPHAVLQSLNKERNHISFQKHTNSHVFLLVDDIWKIPYVEDVTDKLQSAWY